MKLKKAIAATAIAISLVTTAFSTVASDFGTSEEALEMLNRAIVALKED